MRTLFGHLFIHVRKIGDRPSRSQAMTAPR